MISRDHVSLSLIQFAAFFVSGCEHARDITKSDLLERTTHWKEAKVAIWYYMGSKQGHDYFRYHDLGISQFYRVPSGEIALKNTFAFTTDQSKWIVMPWGPVAKRNQSSRQAILRLVRQ